MATMSKWKAFGQITVTVLDKDSRSPVRDAKVLLISIDKHCNELPARDYAELLEDADRVASTNDEGSCTFTKLQFGCYAVVYGHYPRIRGEVGEPYSVVVDLTKTVPAVECIIELALGLNTVISPAIPPRVGDWMRVDLDFNFSANLKGFTDVDLSDVQDARQIDDSNGQLSFSFRITNAGQQTLTGAALLLAPLDAPDGSTPDGAGDWASLPFEVSFDADEAETATASGPIAVSMTRTETEPTPDLNFWGEIRSSTDALSFNRYMDVMDSLFCGNGELAKGTSTSLGKLLPKRFLPFTDTDAYRVMKAATEAFVMANCGVLKANQPRDKGNEVLSDLPDYLARRGLPRSSGGSYRKKVDGSMTLLPYLAIIRRKLPDVPISDALNDTRPGDIELCDTFVREKLRNPCLIELIWSYWHEEAMQVQTINSIMRRYQNVRGPNQPDPLANVEINPLRPLNNLLWGYVQDEQHRLTVQRRNYEYDHHYGLRLEGRAVQDFRPADTRSKFIEAFHHLLRLCTEFYRQDDDTTVKADAFGVLNALKEVHLILSEGAHNQFGDLPSTARVEMLMQQWLLARPEFREFLPTRVMVAYPEPWMDRVDAMKKLQGWTDTSVIHFNNLAVFGEQILLSIRWGAWSVVFEPIQALNFARFWRPQIQGYIHAYRAATGAELGAPTVSAGVDATLPSVLLQKRLAAQQRSSGAR